MDKRTAAPIYYKLAKDIRRYDYHYHALGEELVTNAVYDDLRKSLRDIEKQFPDLAVELGITSPTDLVGFTPVGGRFERVRHGFPMQSLANAFTVEDLLQWVAGLPLPIQAVIETKLDGLSLSLTYVDGSLVAAVTRGDGEIGEDVTTQVWAIGGVPYLLNYEGSNATYRGMATIRGEVVVHNADFRAYNEKARSEGRKEFANTRNMAAGSLRLTDRDELSKRCLQFYAYSVDFVGGEVAEHSGDMDLLKGFGFNVAPLIHVDGDLTDAAYLEALIKDFQAARSTWPFEIDGEIFKVNSYAQQQLLGARSASPRWAIAWKFPADEKTTQLKKVDYQIGRTGVLTPVARVEPVQICGVIVSNVTLHNLDEIQRLDLREDDFVSIRRSGDVIPQILCTIPHLRPKHSYSIMWPSTCPVCKFGTQVVVSKTEGSKLFCTNAKCLGRHTKLMEYQVSRDVLNMDEFGPATCEAITKLDRYTIWDVLWWGDAELSRIESSAVMRLKMLQSIKKARTQPLARVIMSLGIDNCAEGTSDRLARTFCDWGKFWEADYDALKAIDDIGPTTAGSIVEWRIANSDLREAIADVVTIVCPEPMVATGLTGKSVLVTGSKFNGKTRKEVETLLKAQGAKATKGITSGTSLALFGTAYTERKLQDAIEHKVPYIRYGENEIVDKSDSSVEDPTAA